MFDANAYGQEIADILALEANGQRPMALVRSGPANSAARQRIQAAQIAPLLRAGLYLYFGCWDDAHTVAQDIETAEGSYWHAIVHRQEPDPGNAMYWFRQVGAHAIFPALRDRAIELGVPTGAKWDPQAFIRYCEDAAAGSDEERKAKALQLAEWQLLFEWCAR